MKLPLGLIQIVLLVLWYTVPAFAVIPWFVIFLPLFIIAGMLGFALFMIVPSLILTFICTR